MTGASRPCRDDSLMTLLRDELPEGETAILLDHLESCPVCQQRLSDLVASGDEWKRVAIAISEGCDSAEDLRSFSVPAFGRHSIAWTESMAQQLLSPGSHPEMLGRLGRYDVERLIGSGGMGVVFKAYDSELNRPVAIKVLAPYLAASGPARQRFSREARAAAAVVHPHVVPIHNVETDRNSPFIVMQYVSGGSLQDRIDREGPLKLCEILRIGSQVAAGLAAAHQQGLVHRDIKPSNILLEDDVDRAMIGDFGLARAADDASLTGTGFHPGTPQYMSPEQASGQSVDIRSDVFSLGSTLYTMCTGRPPFRAEHSLSVMRRIAECEPTPIPEANPDIPSWLCGLINKMMAKQKADRFQAASDVHELLEACLRHVQQPATVPLPAVPGYAPALKPAPFFSRARGFIVLSSIVSAAALLGYWALFSDSESQHEQSGDKSKFGAEQHGRDFSEGGQAASGAIERRLSWRELLGDEAPDGYSTDLLSLIEGLNNSRGESVFAGTIARDGKEVEFEGTMRIQGGFKNGIQLGAFPQWTIEIAWPRVAPTTSLALIVMAVPEPDALKLMLVPQFAADGESAPNEHRMYGGVWDAKTATVTWTPQQIRLPGKAGESAPGAIEKADEADADAFKLAVNSNGDLQLSGYQHNDSVRISGQTAARVGKPFVEEQTTLEKLPKGYKVFFAGRTEVYVVTATGDAVVGPRVEAVGCDGDVLFGRVVGYEHVPEKSDAPGYFWLDANSGEISKGMELSAWRNDLKSKGIAEPRLAAPEEVGEQY